MKLEGSDSKYAGEQRILVQCQQLTAGWVMSQAEVYCWTNMWESVYD